MQQPRQDAPPLEGAPRTTPPSSHDHHPEHEPPHAPTEPNDNADRRARRRIDCTPRDGSDPKPGDVTLADDASGTPRSRTAHR